MGYLFAIILAFVSLPALGVTYYIDPSCSNNGDGTSQACAASVGGVGAYNTWRVSAISSTGSGAGNSYLQKAGTTFTSEVQIGLSGTASSPVYFGSYGGLPKPIIAPSSGGSDSRGIRIAQDAHDIIIDGFDVRGPTNVGTFDVRGIVNTTTGDDSVVTRITIKNVSVSGTVNASASSPTGNQGIDLRGRENTIRDSTVSNAGSDGVFVSGSSVLIDNVNVSNISNETTNGDCWQIASGGGGIVQNSECDHTNADSKYCGITDSGGTFRNNICRAFVSGSVNTGFFCNEVVADNPCFLYGNTVYNGLNGLQSFSDGSVISGNLVIDPRGAGIIAGDVDIKVLNNTIIRGPTSNGSPGIQMYTPGFTGHLYANNIVSGFNIGMYWYSATATDFKEQNNIWYNSVATPIYNVTTSLPTAISSSSSTSNPNLDASYVPADGSIAYTNGAPLGWNYSIGGRCLGTQDVGAFCNGEVIPYGYTHKPKRRR